MSSTAIIIVNYNMPERTDALCEEINKRVKSDYRLIVVDNGSDIVNPSWFTELALEKNVQTTGGWLAGLEYADTLFWGVEPFHPNLYKDVTGHLDKAIEIIETCYQHESPEYPHPRSVVAIKQRAYWLANLVGKPGQFEEFEVIRSVE